MRQAVAARANVGQTWCNGGQPLARPQQPQLARPVCKGSTQPLDVRVSGPELGFDGSDLDAAPGDSCGRLPAFLGDFLERAAVAVEGRFLGEADG